MYPPVYDRFSSNPQIVAVVGDRIFGHGEAPELTNKPYIVWQSLNGSPLICLGEAPNTDRWTIGIYIYAVNTTDLLNLMQVIRDEIYAFGGTVTDFSDDIRDEETRLFTATIAFDWFYPR
ncbi:MAG: tail completion protein gp17 [Gammaproteobacteria bacterium]